MIYDFRFTIDDLRSIKTYSRAVLFLAFFLAALPVLHSHPLESNDREHDASCPLATIRKCGADVPAIVVIPAAWHCGERITAVAGADPHTAEILSFSSLRAPPLA